MLNLPANIIEGLKQQVISDDESEIRERCGFRKDAAKYPIVYKEQVPESPYPETHVVEYMAIIGKSEYPKMSSLLIRLQDGGWTRICAAHLNEMQSEGFGMPENMSAEALADDDLFS